jgi:hypothetical protein
VLLPTRCAEDELPADRRAVAAAVPSLAEALAVALDAQPERRRAA